MSESKMKMRVNKLVHILLIPLGLVAGIIFGIYLVIRLGLKELDEWAERVVEERGWKLRGE